MRDGNLVIWLDVEVAVLARGYPATPTARNDRCLRGAVCLSGSSVYRVSAAPCISRRRRSAVPRRMAVLRVPIGLRSSWPRYIGPGMRREGSWK